MSKNKPSKLVKINKLPKFKAVDISGNLITSDQTRGQSLFFQFIDPRESSDLSLLVDVQSNWMDEDIQLLAVLKNTRTFKRRYKNKINNLILIDEVHYDEILKQFEEGSNGQSYFIFNDTGRLVSFGKNFKGYNDGPKMQLKKLLHNDFYEVSHFIPLNENINNVTWLNQISTIIERNDKSYYVFSFFTSICSGCPSGKYINTLDELFNRKKPNVYFSVILNNRFLSEDISKIRSQLNIFIPIQIADADLSKKWNGLIREYREKELTNIIIVSDKGGDIIRVFDSDCNCAKQFFGFLNSIR